MVSPSHWPLYFYWTLLDVIWMAYGWQMEVLGWLIARMLLEDSADLRSEMMLKFMDDTTSGMRIQVGMAS